jgi:hypothetical protein
MTVLVVWNFVLTFLNVLRDLVPAISLFSLLIYAFGCFSVAFFYVYHRVAVVVILATTVLRMLPMRNTILRDI